MLDPYLKRLWDGIESVVRKMPEDELLRRSATGKWSPAEILEHLNLTYWATIKNMGRRLNAEKPLAARPTLKQRLQTVLVIGAGYFPSGRKSPDYAEPKGAPAEQLREEIRKRILEMDELIGKCETKFGSHALIAEHPILGPLTARQWRKFHWVHGRHHLRQISRMRAGK